MSFEHQARIIGMGLLLGQIPFRALAEAWQAISPPGNPDLDALLAELQRQGILTEEARTALHAQVVDLEWLIEGAASENDPKATTERPAPPPTAVLSLPPSDQPPEVPLHTPTWAPEFQTQPWSEVSRHLLSALTLPRWNQFTNLQFVGEGGMGRIFKAFDPTLNRNVALKFLRWEDRNSISNLVREARSQAQVDHPNICRVYEVKEWHGLVYVVMQYIEGQTLDRVAPLLDLDEKLELMEKVADAIHTAHRQALIHRDLKPTNIMVERGPEGTFIPYVLDFGLARDLGKANETREGTIQGTAHYMAPEQARGDTTLIERRTDVYALGVTLYELFAGAPPFAEVAGMDCLVCILNEPIPSLRTRNPSLPADLQTIVMKCLEKDISHRYESARALGDDLRRFRNGEPILARPTSLGYRLGKFVLKYKTFVALGVAALAVVVVFAFLGLQARYTAASQAQWAQHFGQEAERIEALLRYVRLQPVHDIQGELATVQLRIRAIETELKGAPSLAQGPGHYALGRASLALGEISQAQVHLDRAWQTGFRAREVAYARGRTMGQIYARALDTARAIQDPRLRETRLQELEETLRAPAVALLQEGRGSLLDPPGFQEGLLARYDHRYDESLRLAKSALKGAPWFYEALRLEGEVYLACARLEQDPVKTLAYLDKAGTSLQAALTTAPSDPALWDLLSRRWWEEMVTRRRAGLAFQQPHQQLQEACANWQRLLPQAPDPEIRLARGELEAARAPRLDSAVLPREKRLALPPLARALQRTETLLSRNPNHPDLLGALASGLQLRAYQDFNRGKDPRADLARAISLLQRAMDEGTPAFELFEPFVASHWARVEFEKSQGRNPAPQVEEALKALQALAQRYPRVADFPGYLGGLQAELVDYQATHGLDPAVAAQRALRHLERASTLAPARFEFHFSRGNVYLAWSQFHLLGDQDANPSLTDAEAAYRTALARNTSTEGAMLGLGEVGLLRCQALERQERPYLKVLAKAEEDVAPLQNQKENWRVALFNAEAARLRALVTPSTPQTWVTLTAAERAANRALAQGGSVPPSLLVLAQIHLAWANLKPAVAGARRARARQLLQELLTKDPAFEPARQLVKTL
ncbi:MAG: protein kinase [Holophaga sp.]|nr:protein kinase [Holophaga sp.]